MSLEDARADFYEAPIDGFTCDETLYGFPQEFNIEYGATLVNTEIAAAAGVDATAGWASWDEFKADAKAMTETRDGTITRAGYHFTAGDGLPFTFYSLILQAGGHFLAEDGQSFTIDTPEAREAVALMQSIVDEGITDPTLFNDTENWVGDCYFEEVCSMGLVGPWVITDYEADFPEVVAGRVRRALEYIPADKLVLSTDCGFGRQGFNRHIAFYKSTAIPQGRNIILEELGVAPRYVPAADEQLAWDWLPDFEPLTHVKPLR